MAIIKSGCPETFQGQIQISCDHHRAISNPSRPRLQRPFCNTPALATLATASFILEAPCKKPAIIDSSASFCASLPALASVPVAALSARTRASLWVVMIKVGHAPAHAGLVTSDVC